MKFYTYILRSLKDGTYYYGSTADLKKRLQDHNAGKSKFTKGHRPYTIHYVEEFSTKSEALKRETFFKSLQGHSWLRSNRIIQKHAVPERWPSG